MSYQKIILQGNLGSAENWSISTSWRNFELFPAVMTQEMIESLALRLVTNIPSGSIPSALKTLLSTSASITGWRVEQRDEGEELTNVGEAAYNAPIAGTGAASKSPQDAIVVSLRTTTPGARGRGRVYWPALGATLGSDFALTTPASDVIALAAATLFDLIGDQINAEWAANSIAVTTELAVRSVTDHQSRTVVRLQVGNRMDTQRRRRDRLVENYAVQSYPLP